MNKEQLLAELDSVDVGLFDLGIMQAIRHFIKGGYYDTARRYAESLSDSVRESVKELLV
jgi:hypothetical protein